LHARTAAGSGLAGAFVRPSTYCAGPITMSNTSTPTAALTARQARQITKEFTFHLTGRATLRAAHVALREVWPKDYEQSVE
jgi:hypothetical protein